MKRDAFNIQPHIKKGKIFPTTFLNSGRTNIKQNCLPLAPSTDVSQIKKNLSLRFPAGEGYLQSCTCVTKVCEHLRSPLDAGSFSRDRQTTLLSISSPNFPLYFFPNLVFCVLMRLGGCYSYFLLMFIFCFLKKTHEIIDGAGGR